MSAVQHLADEDLRGEIINSTLRFEPSIHFATVVNVGKSASSDDVVLEYAGAHKLIVVSHDVNTMKAAAENRIRNAHPFSGLFLVPQSRPTRVISESLVLIWSASEAEEWIGRIVCLPI